MDSKNLHFFTFRFLILNSLFSTIYDCQSIHPDAHIYILTAVRTGRKKKEGYNNEFTREL